MTRTNRWIVVSVVLALVVVLLAPFVWTELSEGRTPPPLGLETSAEPSPDVEEPGPGPFDVDGRWSVGPGSAAGFRATLQDAPADERTVVGSTDDAAGWVEVDAGEATAARVEVRTATLSTGSPAQDRLLRQALEVDVSPTSVFTLTAPLDVEAVERADAPVELEARGTLTILDETQPVTVALEAERSGEGVQLRGAIAVRFSDYGIVLPPSGPVQVEDQGTVEMRLALTRSAA
jgi:polyisoprenoid-binding protein YceI